MKGIDLLNHLQELTPEELTLPVLIATPEGEIHPTLSVGWQNIRYGDEELTPVLREHAFPTGDAPDEYFVPLILIRSI